MTPNRAGGLGLLGSIVPALCGLLASGALLVDLMRARPVFCAEGGGCDAVKQSAFSAPLGIPLPLIGTLGFIAIGVAALTPGRRARLAQLFLSGAAGLVGLALIAEQAKLGDLCPFCCVVDGSAILGALVAATRMAVDPDAVAGRGYVYAAIGTLGVGLAAPPLLAFAMNSVPKAIRDEMAQTPKGAVTVVDFVDFECPYCRMTHAELDPVVESHKDRVRLVRVQVPLRSHPHALDAARAACCGEQLGRGDEMAAALFSTPVESLTPQGCEAVAQRIGVPIADYRACVADPSTSARIESDRARFKAAGGHALPTIWIGDHELIGAQSRAALSKVLADALARAGS
ncbi:MAG TPA: thioredoxin domain-containing protein [Polyangiaceae bacterium]